MTNELEIFAGALSSNVFFYISGVFVIVYASIAFWITRQPLLSTMPGSLIRRAL